MSYSEVFLNHHVALFFKIIVMIEVSILIPLSPQEHGSAYTKGPE